MIFLFCGLNTNYCLNSKNFSLSAIIWQSYFVYFNITKMVCFFSVIFCEAVAIYGVIVAIILQTKLESVPSSQLYAPESLRAGYAIFASGIIVGFANLVCG